MAVRKKQVSGWLNLAASAALALLVWGLLTVLSTRPALKRLWDFSPQARFSVEAATAELLHQIRESGQKVEFHTVFYPLHTLRPNTPEGRQQVANLRRVQELTADLLRQYQYLGGDAVEVTHHDLQREPAKVREVLREISNRRYNSVVIKLGKRSRVLSLEVDLAEFDHPQTSTPQGMPGGERRLPTLRDYKGEEAISTALKRLLVEGTPKVYFLSGYSRMAVEGIGTSYSSMLHALEEDGFAVEFLDLERAGRIPDDAAVVCIVNPTREVPRSAAELLYQHVRGGGRLLINVQYYEPRDFNVSLRSLGERFGFELSDELVCHLVQDPRNPNQSLQGDPACQNLVVVDLNPTHPVTRPLLLQQRYPRFKAGREVRARGGIEGVRTDAYFLRTGPGAWLEARPVDFVAPEDARFEARSIGAVVDVDAEEGARAGHAVVIAAAGFENLGFEANGDLALNVFNWLAERDVLISVRGRKYVSRKLELQPQQLDRVGWLLIGGVPGVLLLLGLFVFWRRSRT